MVDSQPAGYLQDVQVQAGDRVALLVLTNAILAQKSLRQGVVRVIDNGRIQLRTDLIGPNAPALEKGAFIPLQEKAEFTVRKYANSHTLLLALAALAIALILCIAFRKLFNLGLVTLCLAMAGLTGWVLYPYLVPQIQKLYAMAPSSQISANAGQQDGTAESGAPATASRWQGKALDLLEQRPDPRLAAFAVILILSFFPYAFILGKSVRLLRGEK